MSIHKSIPDIPVVPPPPPRRPSNPRPFSGEVMIEPCSVAKAKDGADLTSEYQSYMIFVQRGFTGSIELHCRDGRIREAKKASKIEIGRAEG